MITSTSAHQRAAESAQRWRDQNPEKVAEQRRLRGQHASPVAKRNATERTRRWRESNPEKALALGRSLYQNSPTTRAKAKARSQRWYASNKEQARATVRSGRQDKRAFLAEVVGAGCVDCGDDRDGAVEYHHPDGKTKGQVPLTHLSWDNLKDEAMKLIALCGACHGVRHHKERRNASS